MFLEDEIVLRKDYPMLILKGKTFVVPVANFYDEKEFWYPYFRLQEEGGKVIVLGDKAGGEYKSKSGMAAVADKAYGEVKATDVDGIVIPGGFAPDYMRRSRELLDLVKALCDQDKLVAFICHAGWVPISAGILKNRRATSVGAIKDDLVNAGCIWEDKAVVVDRNLISSRTPADLPQFFVAIMTFFGGK